MKLLSGGVIVGSILAGSALANPGPKPEPEVAQGPVFVASAFARLDPRTPELGKRFSWPATGSFQATHQQVASATPFRMIAGQATLVERSKTRQQQVFVALDPTPDSNALRIYVQSESGAYDVSGALWTVPTALWRSSADKPFTHTNTHEGLTVRFTPTAVAPSRAVEAAAWTDWTYATTLMAVTKPVYLQEPPGFDRWGPTSKPRGEREREHLARIEKAIKKGDSEAALAAITAALATSIDDTGVWGFGWENVAAWAEARRALDAAMGVRARYRPIGRCSMDSAPQEAAMAYADLCYAAGKLGCFLDLQVRVMGDQFERVASSSYGEAAHDTHSQRLRNIGIDPARFLRGLVFRFGVPNAAGAGRRELDPWRLARSMKEAGLVPEMTAFLKAAATKAELDTFNRMRAAETYAYLRFHNETPANRFRLDDTARQVLLISIREDLMSFNLPEPAASWARTFGKN